MAASLLAEGVTLSEAKTRIGAAGEVRNLVALARRKDPAIPEDYADTLLGDGKTVEQSRAALFDRLVADEEARPTSSHVVQDDGGDPAARIVDNYRTAIGSKPKTS